MQQIEDLAKRFDLFRKSVTGTNAVMFNVVQEQAFENLGLAVAAAKKANDDAAIKQTAQARAADPVVGS
jgi:hypothetical protein